ncbi:hypothetical protein AVO45_05885 [Ruegeria marisrubri]|uniref:Uncharacterized protein n=2 Tax=Ruegeria marisrubri TaxID=1685379 RepID=A0A0X3TXX6_9RHOB|nr:hypothetical protein AVO45_05885 [Ruegeria marisrubri]
MKRTMRVLALIATATSFVSMAGAAPNGFRAEAINSTDFEVIPRSRNDISGYWCAAADFARRKLGAGWTQPIYVLRGFGPSVTTGRKTAVQFTLDPGAAGLVPSDQGWIRSGLKPGDSMSVQRAQGFCEPVPVRP